jgi:hypothetical protein
MPTWLNVWDTLRVVAFGDPSSKLHCHEVGEKLLVSVNCTVRGPCPVVTLAVKPATGTVWALAGARIALKKIMQDMMMTAISPGDILAKLTSLCFVRPVKAVRIASLTLSDGNCNIDIPPRLPPRKITVQPVVLHVIKR